MDDACVHLRPLEPADIARLALWLADPDVGAFYDEPPDAGRLARKLLPRTLPGSRVRPWVLVRGGVDIGYGQTYLLTPDERLRLGLEGGSRWGGFDLFLGAPGSRGRGVGVCAVGALVADLVRLGAESAAIDAWTGNGRALRCYAKAGFRIRGRIAVPWFDGAAVRDHWVLVREQVSLPDPGPEGFLCCPVQ